MKDHVVYYAWDADDWLLYVGCTRNLGNRMLTHHGAAWFPFVARVERSEPLTLTDARALEAHEIRTLCPQFNRNCNSIVNRYTRAEYWHAARVAALAGDIRSAVVAWASANSCGWTGVGDVPLNAADLNERYDAWIAPWASFPARHTAPA